MLDTPITEEKTIYTGLKRTPLKSKRIARKVSGIGSTPKRRLAGQIGGNKKKPKSLSKYKKELDAVFSRFIRERDDGQCYTCPKKGEIKTMQNGHFIPRQYLAVRWDETNNHCQCYACNMLYNGQPGAYAIRLEQDYGTGTVARLEARRKELTKLSPAFYEEKIAHYKALLQK